MTNIYVYFSNRVPLENLSVTRNKNLICHKSMDKSYLVIDTLFLHQFCEITA